MNEKIKKLLIPLALGAAVFLMMGAGPSDVTPENAKAMVQKQGALLLDVRTPGEFSGGHIEGAVNIPVQELSAKLGALPAKKDAPIVVYCRSGARSASAKSMLEAAGYTNVHNLGSISNWK